MLLTWAKNSDLILSYIVEGIIRRFNAKGSMSEGSAIDIVLLYVVIIDLFFANQP